MGTLDLGDLRFSIDDSFGLHTLVLRGTKSTEIEIDGRPASFRSTLVVARTERPLKDKKELEMYAEASARQLQAKADFKEVSRKPMKLPKGNPAILQRHKFKDEHGLLVEQLQLFALQKGPAVVLTATELSGPSFNAREKALTAMFLSLVDKS